MERIADRHETAPGAVLIKRIEVFAAPLHVVGVEHLSDHHVLLDRRDGPEHLILEQDRRAHLGRRPALLGAGAL